MSQRFAHGLKDEHVLTSVCRIRDYNNTFSESDTILTCPQGKSELDNKKRLIYLPKISNSSATPLKCSVS